MRTAFVTGGTGFLGRNLIERLTAAGWSVAALHRSETPPEQWRALDVCAVRGEVTDDESVLAAIPGGTDAIFHAAADTSPWSGHAERQRAVNIGGTENVIAAARKRQAGRLIHISSCSVWGHYDRPLTEDMPQKGAESRVGYVRTKALAEARVRAAGEAVDAVILNPSHIIGRYDSRNWARMFILMDRDALPGVPPGGGCFANVGDVADAAIAAVDRGRRGENYLLGGPHASFLEVAREIARLLGKPPPRRAAPAFLLKAAGFLGEIKGRLTGEEPDITPEAAYFVCHDERVSSEKARRELDYRETPLAQSLAACHAWLVERGLVGG